jgi:hypothetical protein
MADNAPLQKGLRGIPGVDVGDEPEEPDEVVAGSDSDNQSDDRHNPAPPPRRLYQANNRAPGGSCSRSATSHEQQNVLYEHAAKTKSQGMSGTYFRQLHATEAYQRQAGDSVVPAALATTTYHTLSVPPSLFPPLVSSSAEHKNAGLVLENKTQLP